jgi:hypothetical protein
METLFPEGNGYRSLFLVGYRKDPGHTSLTQRIGAVIVKRTYHINSLEGIVTPAARTLPIFVSDQPDNLVVNGDFASPLADADEKDNFIDWHPEGVTIARGPNPAPADPYETHFLEVAGAANGRIVQTLAFEEPLGGRQFQLSFSASANAIPTAIRSVQLEADSQQLCVITASVGTTMNRFSAGGTWPAGLQATEMRVVLRMAADAARTVFYSKVQVEERSYLTRWDPATTLLYEHDLASFKPEGDLIVLGFADVMGVSAVSVNGVAWLRRTVMPTEKALFGWEPRKDGPRKEAAGSFPTEPDAYPLSDPLPADFRNHFYNGYRRTNVDVSLPASSYVPPAAQIEITRGTVSPYRFALRSDRPTAAYSYYSGRGQDEAHSWLSESIAMNLDTLVIEPEKNRCYALWRGAWPFDAHREDAYRRLAVQAPA